MPLPVALEKLYSSVFSDLDSLNRELEEYQREKKLEFKAQAMLLGPVIMATKQINESLQFADTLFDPPQEDRPTRHRRRAARSEVRSFIFPKDNWTPVAARAWLRDHNKKFGQMEVIGSSFHFPQTEKEGPILGTVVVKHQPRIMATVIPREP